ncbi:hypothetical protein, partial [Flavobacterium sp.]
YSFDWANAPAGTHTITAVATDNSDAETTSAGITINVTQVAICTETSSTAQQGAFTTGYEIKFETSGNNVIITATLLDTDKTGVVAFLWRETPFAETEMQNTSGLSYTSTVGGLTAGQTITYAIKFAYAGGMSVTEYFT